MRTASEPTILSRKEAPGTVPGCFVGFPASRSLTIRWTKTDSPTLASAALFQEHGHAALGPQGNQGQQLNPVVGVVAHCPFLSQGGQY